MRKALAGEHDIFLNSIAFASQTVLPADGCRRILVHVQRPIWFFHFRAGPMQTIATS